MMFEAFGFTQERTLHCRKLSQLPSEWAALAVLIRYSDSTSPLDPPPYCYILTSLSLFRLCIICWIKFWLGGMGRRISCLHVVYSKYHFLCPRFHSAFSHPTSRAKSAVLSSVLNISFVDFTVLARLSENYQTELYNITSFFPWRNGGGNFFVEL